MNTIEDYHPEDFDVCVRPGVTREDLNHHVKDDGAVFLQEITIYKSVFYFPFMYFKLNSEMKWICFFLPLYLVSSFAQA